MELLKNWTICICITLVVATIFSLIIPTGNMGSFYKIIISLFVFLSFVFPLKDAKINNEKLDFGLGIYDENVNENDVISNLIEAKINNTLKKHSIDTSTINVDAYQNDYEIEIKSVLVEVEDMNNSDEIKNIIYNELGINAEVKSLGN